LFFSNDALRQHGILPPRPAAPRTPSPPPSPTLDDLLADYTPKELQEAADDALDDDDARTLDAYRRQRIAEMRNEQLRARFGRVYPIGKDDYQREVTDASKVDEDEDEGKGRGTGVVCFLYKDGHLASERAFGHIRALAARHPRTKFVSIVGDKCIPDYPDRHLPTLFVYRSGRIINQQTAWGSERERSLEELEALLILAGAIPLPDRLPTRGDGSRRDEDSDDEQSHRQRSFATSTNGAAPKNIRSTSSSHREDSDGDSDFDL